MTAGTPLAKKRAILIVAAALAAQAASAEPLGGCYPDLAGKDGCYDLPLVWHYCKTEHPDTFEACRQGPPSWAEMTAWKEQRRRASGYRDPDAAPICSPPHRMTRDGCQ